MADPARRAGDQRRLQGAERDQPAADEGDGVDRARTRGCERVAREADDALLSPVSEAEWKQFMGLLIRISGTDG